MLIKLRCRACFAKISGDHDLIGKKVNCPSCNHSFTLPKPLFGFGKNLDGYEVEQWLGDGAMGEVYLARQISMNRPVALKVIKHDLDMDPEVIERFNNEAKILASLNHPNIVSAVDSGQTSECYYMAMSFVDGETLEDKMKRRGRLDEQEALVIFKKVAHAIGYAWTEFKLLHRDIKPANIMIDSREEVKIMDMGIAKNMNDDNEGGLTRVGLVVGTPFYMSPEQAQASADIDYRSDIYSLAASMYHLLTNVLPFQGPNVMAILARKVSFPLIPINEINPGISKETSDLIAKLLNYKVHERVGSLEELDEAIEGAILAAKSKKREQLTDTLAQGTDEDSGHMAETAMMPKSKKSSKKKFILPIVALLSICVILSLILLSSQKKAANVPKDIELSTAELKKNHLLFSWQASNNKDRDKILSIANASRGISGEMRFRNGAFKVNDLQQKSIDKILQTKAFSIHIDFRTKDNDQADVALFSIGVGNQSNISLQHKKKSLFLRYRDTSGKYHTEKIKDMPHLLQRLSISYANGEFTIYDHGKLLHTFKSVNLLCHKWSSPKIIFGNIDLSATKPWRGTIFNFLMLDRSLNSENVLAINNEFKVEDQRKRFKR
jgi:serine/threonine protein kinase